MKEFSKVAIVTGAGRNIGKAIALRLAQDGFHLVLAGPEFPELESTAVEIQALGPQALPMLVDVRQEDQVRILAEKTLQTFGRIDVLVNNAAIAGPTAPVANVALADWAEVLTINLTGPFLCSKAVLPAMMAQRAGKIINLSSIAGRFAYPLRSPYAASKWGLIGLTKTLAKEVGEYNIQVNAICPGPVAGERMRNVISHRAKELGQTEEEVRDWYFQQMVLRRMVEPEDIAAMAAFLASPQGDNITGQTLDVNAGYGL